MTLIVAVGLAILCLGIGLAMASFRLDDSFIIYRYARNIAAGVGFVYNAGERVLSTTTPLYTLLLAGLWFVMPDLPALGNALSAAAIGGAGLALYALGRDEGRIPALVMAGVYATFPLMWLTLGMETALLIFLGVSAVWAQARGRGMLAALLLGLAALTRPDALALAPLLALDALLARRVPWREGLVFLGVLAPWAIWSSLYFGSPLPATLTAKGAQTAMGVTGFAPGVTFPGGLALIAAALFEQSPLWVGAAALAVLGLARVRRRRWAMLLVGWALLHVLGYTILGVAPYRWYYAPLAPGVAALIGLGASALFARLPRPVWRWAVLVLFLTLIAGAAARSLWLIYQTPRHDARFIAGRGIPMLPTVDWDIYREAGEWLNRHTPPEALIGVSEVGQLGYYADRCMVDYLGLLQPEVAAALGRRDVYWWLPHYAPDYLVLGGPSLYGYPLGPDDWFNQVYREVERFEDPRYRTPKVIYARRLDLPPLEAVPVEAAYTGGLTLTGVATDLPLGDLSASQPARVRLGWRVDAPQPPDAHIVLTLTGWDGAPALQVDRAFATHDWPVGEALSTYHTLVLAGGLPPGVYDLCVGVERSGGEMDWRCVARGRAPIGNAAPLPDGLTETDIALGGLALLKGYRLDRAGDMLDVTVIWEALAATPDDYAVFVHLRDEEGANVLVSGGQPREGAYPTSIWAAGEIIPDGYRLPLSDAPPGRYALYVGLYHPESGARLLTPDGQDSILLGMVTVP